MKFLKSLASKLYSYAVRYPLAAAATILIIVGSVFMIAAGRKVQIGGVLGWLWGKKRETAPDVRLLPPPDRKGPDGKLIDPGKSDEKGFVQVPVQVLIEDPGLFSDPNTIVLNHPDRGREVVDLPTGVKNEDIKQVVEISPKVYQVKNADTGVDAGSLLDELGVKK